MIYQPLRQQRLTIDKKRVRVRSPETHATNTEVSHSGLVNYKSWNESSWGHGFTVEVKRMRAFVQ